RQHEEAISVVGAAGCGVIIRGGVARGEPGSGLGDKGKWNMWDKAKMGELLSDGETRTGFLLRYTISHPHMHTTIVGTKNPDHLTENIKMAEAGPLPADIYKEAKRRFHAAGESPEPV
ncbi:MAG: aldo/keto reductase, partial [Chloroflexi bacterium]|nr:aldo/keto reductase [Chloroflexota bacterium]